MGTRFIDEYDDVTPCYDSSCLREEIATLRCSFSSSVGALNGHAWGKWRAIAGLVRVVEKKNEGDPPETVPLKVSMLTQKQAALIVLQALWKPKGTAGVVKVVVGSDLDSKDLNACNVEDWFNEWARVNGCKEAADLLNRIYEKPTSLDKKQLQDVGKVITGEVVPIRKIERWVGAKIGRDAKMVPSWIVKKAIQRMIDTVESYSGESMEDYPKLPPSS